MTTANALKASVATDDRVRASSTLRPVVRPGASPVLDQRASVAAPAKADAIGLAEVLAYQRDVWERTVLFWDTLRQRADNMLEHERAGLPPLLDFKSEMLLDARRFDRPVNYALLRITEIGEECWDDCADPNKAPVMVVDPRAGHGPGIGGFKRESEVGIALHNGHPVYFVVFFPEPCADQTLADVLHALRRFVEEVARRHPDKPPILYGNCQAGWALALLSADCAGLAGAVVLNGSPLSYWAGKSGVNPMRIAGGLTGGVWATRFLADLGNGRFDGAWLAQNFEMLKPAKAMWDKYANLFTQVDTERERFLEFERWWGGYYWLSRDEMVAIVEDLFIGNKLEQSEIQLCDNCKVDLRRIRNPLVIFASYGDNITPPYQALGWISAVYRTTSELKAAGQRIVYLTNPHVGHLGIFVSAGVARFEHRAILESLPDIEALPAGLYEMKIDNPTGDPDCHRSQYSVRFEERDVSALHFDCPRQSFERVRQVSEINDKLYQTFVSPWISMAANPWTADILKWPHPMRTSRYLLSESFAPWMRAVAGLAKVIEKDRAALSYDHPLVKQERDAFASISRAIEESTEYRDALEEWAFSALYRS
jgi:hypothetical protein